MQKLGETAEIDDTFNDDHVLAASHDLIPLFANFRNYLASDVVTSDLSLIKGKSLSMMLKVLLG